VYDAYTTTSLVTLGRTLASRWLLQVHGGVGVINPLRQTYFLLSTTPHPAAGGSLGYKTFSQSFLGSFDRTVSDSYGLGAATTSSAGVSWRGSRPGRAWWLESSAGWTQLQGNGVGNTSGWRATAGFGRTMGAHLVLFTQYAYVSYSGKLQNTRYGQDQSAARVSVVWSPHPQMPQ